MTIERCDRASKHHVSPQHNVFKNTVKFKVHLCIVITSESKTSGFALLMREISGLIPDGLIDNHAKLKCLDFSED